MTSMISYFSINKYNYCVFHTTHQLYHAIRGIVVINQLRTSVRGEIRGLINIYGVLKGGADRGSDIVLNMGGSLISGFVGIDSFLEGFALLDVGVVADGTSSVSEEALVDTLEGGVFLLLGFLDSVLVVFVVLVLR